MSKPLHVSLVVFKETDPSVLFGVYDTLWSAGHVWHSLSGVPGGEALFMPRLVAAKSGPMELVTGVVVHAHDSVDAVTQTEIVILPNVIANDANALRALDRGVLDWIRRMYECGAEIYSSCGGSLALAEAGMLDGWETTTHWGYANLLKREYPRVKVRSDRVLVQTGPEQRIVCSGGASSWQDMSLYIIAKHAGPEEAVRIAKVFLYQWHRDGQLPYANLLNNVSHNDPMIQSLQVWLAENYRQQSVVAELIRRSGLPRRSFARRFNAATGYTPLAYVQALRIEEAKHMLERTDMSVEDIGVEVGYQDAVSFRRLFKRLAGVTPAEYRRRFEVPAIAASAKNQRQRAAASRPNRRIAAMN